MKGTMQCARTAIVALSLCMFSSCSCDSIVGERVTNQPGKYSAVTEGSECGATTSYESSVQIERPYRILGHQVWTSSKGVFRATVGNVYDVKIWWIDDRHLSVACHCKKEAVIFNDPNWRDITITYTFSQ